MFKLKVAEEYRCENREEAESFIKAQREGGREGGYEVLKAGYTHKEKKAKGEVVDEYEHVTITKQFCTPWEV